MSTFLFDYGGTLDTAATHWYYVFKAAYPHIGYQIADEQLREAYVTGERALAKERIILPEDNFFTLLQKKITIQLHYLETSLLLIQFDSDATRKQTIQRLATYCDDFARQHVQQSAQVLEQLKQRGHRFIMVSNFYGNLHQVLSTYAIDHYFDSIIESAVVGIRKPDPAIYLLAARCIGSTPENCAYVGDNPVRDVEGAKAAGFGAMVLFEDAGTADREGKAPTVQPDFRIKSIPELLELFPPRQ